MPTNTEKQILVLHGPNMNLIGLASSRRGTRLTLDRINQHLRKQVRNTCFTLKIFQTHDESKAVSFLHRNRKKASAILLSPGPWLQNAFVLKDTLDLLNKPYAAVSFTKRESAIFTENQIFFNEDPMTAYLTGLEKLITILE